jgi:hypothetical protein
MRSKVAGVSLSVVLLLLAVSPVFAGHTSSQLERAGWVCDNAGPNNWVHCFPPGAFSSLTTLTVKVFSVDGNTFLGTEILIQDGYYHDQPCIAEGGGPFTFLPQAATGLPADYWACHR